MVSMDMTSRDLSGLYQHAHNFMRDTDGLLPQEALDELLKFLFYKECGEEERSGVLSDAQGTSATAIREIFSCELKRRAPWALALWRDGQFRVSDRTLLDLNQLFSNIRLTGMSLDVRSVALRTFLNSDARKGLGIFLTPENVVRAMVEVVDPQDSETVLDPACGSGTFLTETVQFLSKRRKKTSDITIYGVEKNPRMLFLADLNLRHIDGVKFQRTCSDSLRSFYGRTPPLALAPNSVDVILTNPPFGMSAGSGSTHPNLFEARGTTWQRGGIPSEILFLDLCMKLLRPDGRLGIILPRSVVTNDGLAERRRMIDEVGYLSEIVDLPPETFASTGTQTTTVAAFFRKHPKAARSSTTSVRVCHVTNVGVDATGRHRSGSDLPQLAKRLSEKNPTGSPVVVMHREISSASTLQRAAKLLFKRNGLRDGATLGEYIELANTGRTPSRSAYTEDGTFILKVGNLTGRGLDWSPRDRNFVSEAEGKKRRGSRRISLEVGDILLTSSAHTARYIAKKVDIVDRIPSGYSHITFVGELMRVRAASDVDPFMLLAALRHALIRDDLQASVRGQTAHLNPSDLLSVVAPFDVRNPDERLTKAAHLLRQEAKLAFELSEISSKATRYLDLS